VIDASGYQLLLIVVAGGREREVIWKRSARRRARSGRAPNPVQITAYPLCGH